MAGTLINELRGRQYGAVLNSNKATRKFQVRSDDQTDDGPDLMDGSVAGLPEYGDAHPKNANLFATRLEAAQDSEAWWLWVITIKYEQPQFNGEEQTPPLSRTARISYETEILMIAAVADRNTTTGAVEDVVGSSAGEPFDPAPEEELEILIINVQRWEAPGFSVATFYDYNGAVNSAAFTWGDQTIGVAEAKLRMRIGPEETYINPADNTTEAYREYNYQIAVSPLGWDLVVLDRGTYYKDGSNIKKFLDDFSEPYVGLLDGSGGALASGGTPVFRTFNTRKRRAFASLSLPAGP